MSGEGEQAASRAVGSAQLGVGPATRIVVGVVELGYCMAGLLPRPAQVLHKQRGQGKRPPEGVRVATAGVFTGAGYVGLIGNAGTNADVVHAIVEERSAIRRE